MAEPAYDAYGSLPINGEDICENHLDFFTHAGKFPRDIEERSLDLILNTGKLPEKNTKRN